eukprot:TRINITY_DN3182_c0_g1_i2.p1 TRINITY_DN3182_c0_g1~~TRINITY_DN3182_c0_g1_i2.p1  ORF type:complete len:194 (-),score=38.11 TRINITY_DN3182_c0_g1_i2:38-619(-)
MIMSAISKQGPKKVSAGFVIRSRQKFLVCHATQSKTKPLRQFDGNWSISKGMVDSGESLIEAAIRELKEETSIDLDKDRLKLLVPKEKRTEMKPFCNYTTGMGKLVHVFLLDDPEGLLGEEKLECTSMIENPDMPHLNGAPEMDAFMFVERHDAYKMVFKNQKFIFGENYLKWEETNDSRSIVLNLSDKTDLN